MIENGENAELKYISVELYPDQITEYCDSGRNMVWIDFVFKDIQKNKGITSLLIDKSIIRRERNGFDNDTDAINKYLERIDIEYAVLTNIEYINRNLKKTKKYQ